MKPYGVTRHPELEWPDKGDIVGMARNSSIGSFPARCGKYKNSNRSVVSKAATRRLQKRKARKAGKLACKET